MAGLTKEATSELWDDMQKFWDIKKGKIEGDKKVAEEGINKIQGILGLDITDFVKETPTQELKEYTLAEAEELLGEENVKLIDKGVDFAIAYKAVSSDRIVKRSPSLRRNPAGIGQMVNISYDQVKDKLK